MAQKKIYFNLFIKSKSQKFPFKINDDLEPCIASKIDLYLLFVKHKYSFSAKRNYIKLTKKYN